jgi:squalene-hopene/tetraprenyl-beta-curcumene cyclase
MTATLLAYATLTAVDTPPAEAQTYVLKYFGNMEDEAIITGLMSRYGSDLTFSVPVLVMCALAGVVRSWHGIPQLPFELSALPQRFFRFLRLPVVSYAIPALIVVGILRHRKGKHGWLYAVREHFVRRSLGVLTRLQPVNGGFLEASPLTAFVATCLTAAGYRELEATQRALGFLIDTVRDDGSWPIDTDLSNWVTVLSVKALGNALDPADAMRLSDNIRRQAFTQRHPFTGARHGGWGWTDLYGAAPDADDTAGALVALHVLHGGAKCPAEVLEGIEWLLDVQNSDGGVPTFCKGWGRLPFDCSTPDITAHAFHALELWKGMIPSDVQRRANAGMRRMLGWMRRHQQTDGWWVPLWFGDQDAADECAPVYGTAVAVEYLAASEYADAHAMAVRGATWLASVQNDDGGWGGTYGVRSKVTLTAKALVALSMFGETYRTALRRGWDYLYATWRADDLVRSEPIGLYFARLWYSEELYNLTFALQAACALQAISAPPTS